MTVPAEMFNALLNARMFMTALANPAETPKVPKEIRQRALDRLRHYPSEHEIRALETMFNNSTQDKGIVIGQTNKELQRIAGEATIMNTRLSELSQMLQEFINKT